MNIMLQRARVTKDKLEEWKEKEEQPYFQVGTILKLQQNRNYLKDFLKHRDEIFAYSNPFDLRNGTGIALNDEHSNEPQYWLGQNREGFSITRVRDYLLENS